MRDLDVNYCEVKLLTAIALSDDNLLLYCHISNVNYESAQSDLIN